MFDTICSSQNMYGYLKNHIYTTTINLYVQTNEYILDKCIEVRPKDPF